MGLFDLFKKKETQSLAEEYYTSNTHQESFYSNSSEQTYNFELMVEDVFSITGRGTVVVGRIETGIVNKGDSVLILNLDGSTIPTNVTAIEMFRKILNSAKAGDNVGLLLDGIQRGDVAKGCRVVR